MGASLIRQCRLSAESIHRRGSTLVKLPDGPSWTLLKNYRNQAASAKFISQLWFRLSALRRIGLSFSVVVGHPSGEVAATYAAGGISTGEVISIAYCRGLHAHLAAGFEGRWQYDGNWLFLRSSRCLLRARPVGGPACRCPQWSEEYYIIERRGRDRRSKRDVEKDIGVFA